MKFLARDPDATALFAQICDQVCDALEADYDAVPPAEASQRVYEQLLARDDRNPANPASRILDAVARDGLRRAISTRLKGQEAAITTTSGGFPVSVKTRISVKRRQPDGSRPTQLTLWWRATPAEFLAYVDRMRAQRDRLSEELSGYDAIAELIVGHADAPTVEDALRRAGADPAAYIGHISETG